MHSASSAFGILRSRIQPMTARCCTTKLLSQIAHSPGTVAPSWIHRGCQDVLVARPLGESAQHCNRAALAHSHRRPTTDRFVRHPRASPSFASSPTCCTAGRRPARLALPVSHRCCAASVARTLARGWLRPTALESRCGARARPPCACTARWCCQRLGARECAERLARKPLRSKSPSIRSVNRPKGTDSLNQHTPAGGAPWAAGFRLWRGFTAAAPTASHRGSARTPTPAARRCVLRGSGRRGAATKSAI